MPCKSSRVVTELLAMIDDMSPIASITLSSIYDNGWICKA